MSEGTNPKDLLGVKKVSLSKIPVAGLIHEAMAMKDGAAKYGPHNWREKKVIGSIYMDAALRHIYSWFDGEECAKDSGVHHLGHAKACLGILLDALETGNLDDDRPIPGEAAELFEQFRETEAPVTDTLIRGSDETPPAFSPPTLFRTARPEDS